MGSAAWRRGRTDLGGEVEVLAQVLDALGGEDIL